MKLLRCLLLITIILSLFISCSKKTTEHMDKCDTPTFSPEGGTYPVEQIVTISSTIGATILYTTDGTDPSSSSPVYTNPIVVSSTTTLKAQAIRDGWKDSDIGTATFTFNISLEEFTYVPGGTFTMGDTRGGGNSDESPTHQVTLSSFHISRHEVTQSQWLEIMHTNPASGYGIGNAYPVYNVSWYAILKYCNLRSIEEGLTAVYSIGGSTDPNAWSSIPTTNNAIWNATVCDWSANGYRLPTEAEWEYAARGASNTPDYFYSGNDNIGAVAWYLGNNSPNGTKPVGTKDPNSLGIYDMSGNIWEWCWDWYNNTYYVSSPQENPTGPNTGSQRVFRGGAFNNNAFYCRVAVRESNYPYHGFYIYGFRLVRIID